MLKSLIIVTLIYYLFKGLIYLILWQTSFKVQERALAAKEERIRKRKAKEELWQTEPRNKNK